MRSGVASKLTVTWRMGGAAGTPRPGDSARPAACQAASVPSIFAVTATAPLLPCSAGGSQGAASSSRAFSVRASTSSETAPGGGTASAAVGGQERWPDAVSRRLREPDAGVAETQRV